MTAVNRVVGDGQLVDELHVTFTQQTNELCRTYCRPTRRSRLIASW